MAEERAQRRLAAILVADVVGYSRLMEQDEAWTLAALAERRKAILEPLFAKYRGRVVRIMGDGTLAEFASAVDAVQCAVDIQKAMREANSKLPEDRAVVLRVGLNVGDVVVEDGDLYGDGVNVAARLEAMADPGGICLTAAIHQQVERLLPFAFRDLGDQALKNIARPVRVYCIADDDSAGVSTRGTPTVRASMQSKPSIAVLPFNNMSGDADSTTFADGLAEDIITELSRVPSLLVIARNSTFTYKNRAVSLKDVARDLAVQYVLEGSVRRSGDQIRVTAQLIDAVADTHVWAERFERSFAHPFQLQDELTKSIVSTIHQQLYLSEGRRALARSDRSNTDLWTLLQRSWARLHDLTPEAVAEARELAERALQMAPDNARANFLVGAAIFHQAFMMYLPDYDALMKQALTYAERAVALDDNDEHAHWQLGDIYWSLTRWDAAVDELERCLEINPNWSLGLSDLGECLCYIGRTKEGIPKIEEAIRVNPKDPSIFFRFGAMALGHYLSENFAAAEQWARKTIQRRRHYYYGHVLLTASLVKLGRLDEAKAAAQELRRLFPDFTLTYLQGAAFAGGARKMLVADLRSAGVPD